MPPTRRSRLDRTQHRTSKIQGDLFTAQNRDTRVVLGLDASLTKYGVSVYAPDTGQHTTMLFKPKMKGARRLREIYQFVTMLVGGVDQSFALEHIVMEDYAPGMKGRTYSIGEGGGVTKLALVTYFGQVPEIGYPTLVSPTGLKKFATGRGGAKKNEILLSVYRKWGVDFSGEDDMADAYALARIGGAILRGETEHQYESQVVESLERHTEWATS